MLNPRIPYRRSRFSTSLPENRLYTAGHYSLEEVGGLWRIGFTRFATRMLGDVVDLEFTLAPGDRMETGQVVGHLEGFKAVTDILSPLAGSFEGANPVLDTDIDLINIDPYGRGWLYQVRGEAGEDCLDVHGYITALDATIEDLLETRNE